VRWRWLWPWQKSDSAPQSFAEVVAPAKEPKPLKISAAAMDAIPAHEARTVDPFRPAKPPPGVLPAFAEDERQPLAMDDAFFSGELGDGYGYVAWPGYPYLAELAQRAEYRVLSEIPAEEMTRKWIEFEVTGDDDKSDKIEKLEAACKRLKLREVFRKAKEHDGLFGRGQIFPLMKGAEGEVLKTPLIADKRTFKKGSLQGFLAVEPFWAYPAQYNSIDPLRKDFFKPKSWYVMGREVHTSRLLMMIGREVPDILKPAYSFGGLSTSQMARVYVELWLKDKQSVSDLVDAFSTAVLKTNMAAFLNGGAADDMVKRAEVFARFRKNRDVFMIDKESEDFAISATPLGTLDELQAQSQEHMAAIARIPLVKLFGITPSGLNASSDGEIRTFYDTVAAQQENDFRDPLKFCLDLIQLSEFGEIDEAIGFKFVSLWQLDEAGEAAVEKIYADILQQMLDAGVIAPEEARQVLAKREKSLFAGLDLSEGSAPGTTEVDGEGKPLHDPLSPGVLRESANAGGGAARGAASGV
jgi:phage-related protein (TIGR01555 family)